MLDLASWGVGSKKRAIDVLGELQRAAAAEGFDPEAKATARMQLARFLLANDLAAETLGALRAAQVNQPQLDSDPQFKLMRAAANLMMGRVKDAQADLSSGSLADDPSAALWRGYGAAMSENWAEARRSLQQGQGALYSQPQNWRARFNLALAESALELNDYATADTAIAQALGEATGEDVRAEGEIVKARLYEARGDLKTALTALKMPQSSPDEAAAVRASLEAVKIGRETGEVSASSAIESLEALRYRWRGDGLELEVIQTLGHVYEDLGRWRDALSVMHAAAARFPDLPAARRMRLDMAGAFEQLFLEGEADKLEPIQALGLFYEFKDLTPIGPDGDRMIRLLSARLVSVDLLEKATELLQYQIDNRLEGVGQAQVAADLAAIYLMDHKPQAAVDALHGSQVSGLPDQDGHARMILEARAFAGLKQWDNALDLIAVDSQPDTQRLRADIYWEAGNWAMAGQKTEDLLGARWSDPIPLSNGERAQVLRVAVSYSLANDEASLDRLRQHYAPKMQSTPDGSAFAVLAQEIDMHGLAFRDAAAKIASVDTLQAFMKDFSRHQVVAIN